LNGWLLDTNILSAFAPGKPAPSPEVTGWFEERTDSLFLSVVTAAEIGAGVAKLRRSGADRRAQSLSLWFERIVTAYGERVLTFDLLAAQIAGDLSDAAVARGHAPGFADVAIAATAKAHRLTVLTANVRHFEPLGADVFDPFQIRPGP